MRLDRMGGRLAKEEVTASPEHQGAQAETAETAARRQEVLSKGKTEAAAWAARERVEVAVADWVAVEELRVRSLWLGMQSCRWMRLMSRSR